MTFEFVYDIISAAIIKEKRTMAYRKGKVVISVPVDIQTNDMLRELALLTGQKSKTRYAANMLTKAIAVEYKQLQKEKKWSKNTLT